MRDELVGESGEDEECVPEERVCRVCKVGCGSVIQLVMRFGRLNELRREWLGKFEVVLTGSAVEWEKLSEEERLEVLLGRLWV